MRNSVKAHPYEIIILCNLIFTMQNIRVLNTSRKRHKQFLYLVDMINKNGGVTDEFDKIVLADLGIKLSTERP